MSTSNTSLAGLFGGSFWGPPAPPPTYITIPTNPFETMETWQSPGAPVPYTSSATQSQYATADAAQLMAKVFKASSIVFADPKTSAFPGTSPNPARLLQFLPGSVILDPIWGALIPVLVPFTVNAGELIEHFVSMPENQFQNMTFGSLARKYGWSDIYQAWSAAVAAPPK